MHKLIMGLIIDNNIVYSQTETTDNIDILQFIANNLKQLFNLLENGKYNNKNIEQAINSGEFRGWE